MEEVRTAACSACGAEKPMAELGRAAGRVLCAGCTMRMRVRAFRLIDPTLCAGCGKDGGTRPWSREGGLPLCPRCSRELRRRPPPLPALAGSLLTAAVLILAARDALGLWGPAAQVREARRWIDARCPGIAVERMKALLRKHPDLPAAHHVYIEALLLAGRLEEAKREMEKYREPPTRRLAELSRKVDRAVLEYRAAMQAYSRGRIRRAAGLIARARQRFPESRRITAAFLLIQGVYAYDAGDLDLYIRFHETLGEYLKESFEARICQAVALAAKGSEAEVQEVLKRAEALASDEASRKRLALARKLAAHWLEHGSRPEGPDLFPPRDPR